MNQALSANGSVRRCFSRFDAATSERLVREAGFEVVSAAEESQVECGRDVPYLWVLARKL